MDTATSIEPTAPTRQAGTSFRAVARRWWVLVVALAVVATAWRVGLTALYLAGLALTVVGLLVALRGRRYLATATVAVVLLVGIGGPWLAVRLAYRPVGVAVSASVESYSDYVTSVGATTLVAHDDTLLAVDDETGAEAWRADVSDLVWVWPLTDGRLLAKSDGELIAIAGDREGQQEWSRPQVWEDDLVAVSDDVVVQRSCVPAEGGPSSCTWVGIDLASGATTWEESGVWAPGWSVWSGDDSTYVRSIETSLFTVRGQDGDIEVHDADTGETVQVVRGTDVYPVLTGDDVLVFRTGDQCSVELAQATGPQWTSDYPCALWDTPDYDISPAGTRVGAAYWGESVEGQGTLVVDLGDGTVRTEGTSYRLDVYPYGIEDDHQPGEVLGAGIDVTVHQDGLVGRDAADGSALWDVGVAGGDIRSVQADGEVVVLSRYHRPLLLHEWFAPGDEGTVAVEVLDAATGESRAVVRTDALPWSPTIVGDQVMLAVVDVDGEQTVRLVGG